MFVLVDTKSGSLHPISAARIIQDPKLESRAFLMGCTPLKTSTAPSLMHFGQRQGSKSKRRLPESCQTRLGKMTASANGLGATAAYTPDVVVIGSGIGGLASAALLAAYGKKVKVDHEKHQKMMKRCSQGKERNARSC